MRVNFSQSADDIKDGHRRVGMSWRLFLVGYCSDTDSLQLAAASHESSRDQHWIAYSPTGSRPSYLICFASQSPALIASTCQAAWRIACAVPRRSPACQPSAYTRMHIWPVPQHISKGASLNIAPSNNMKDPSGQPCQGNKTGRQDMPMG